jgi:hypothetical protein
LTSQDPQRWRWLGQGGSSWIQTGAFSFCPILQKQVELFNSGSGSDDSHVCNWTSFARTRPCELKRTIFNRRRLQISILSSAPQNKQSHSTSRKSKQQKAAMHAWTQVGIQVESCEGREKVDCEIDLGCERRSVVRRVG